MNSEKTGRNNDIIGAGKKAGAGIVKNKKISTTKNKIMGGRLGGIARGGLAGAGGGLFFSIISKRPARPCPP